MGEIWHRINKNNTIICYQSARKCDMKFKIVLKYRYVIYWKIWSTWYIFLYIISVKYFFSISPSQFIWFPVPRFCCIPRIGFIRAGFWFSSWDTLESVLFEAVTVLKCSPIVSLGINSCLHFCHIRTIFISKNGGKPLGKDGLTNH